MEIKERKESKGNLLIILCWLVYTCAYLGKYSYSSNTIMVISHYGVTKADAGLISTLFFIAYGAGQIINGIFCKYYNKKYVTGAALGVSAVINFTLFFDVPFALIKYLWLINGIAQSVLWPTLILTLSCHLSQSKLKTAVLAMATTFSVGTIFSYGFSALFVKILNFKFSFLTSSLILIAACMVWLLFYKRATALVKGGDLEQESEKKSPEKKSLTPGLIFMLICLALFAIINNLVKDGLNTWVPNILKEMYELEDSLSILLTISLALVGIFGSFVAVALHKKIKNFVVLAGVLFACATICVLAVISLFKTSLWGIILGVFGLISLLMHGINNVITSMSPLYLRDKINSGFLSGLMNGACYVGSALSSYGLGLYADNFGWISVFYLLLGCCVIPVVISLIMSVFMYKTSKSKIYKEN